LQSSGQFEEGAQEGGAIVLDQLHQPGFPHEAAELDEIAGAGASVLHGLPGIGAGAVAIEPIAQHGETALPRCRHLELQQQGRRQVEKAVLPSEITRLEDCAGYLKLATRPDWMAVGFKPIAFPARVDAAVPIALPLRDAAD
jgi:hypothetical protein